MSFSFTVSLHVARINFESNWELAIVGDLVLVAVTEGPSSAKMSATVYLINPSQAIGRREVRGSFPLEV